MTRKQLQIHDSTRFCSFTTICDVSINNFPQPTIIIIIIIMRSDQIEWMSEKNNNWKKSTRRKLKREEKKYVIRFLLSRMTHIVFILFLFFSRYSLFNDSMEDIASLFSSSTSSSFNYNSLNIDCQCQPAVRSSSFPSKSPGILISDFSFTLIIRDLCFLFSLLNESSDEMKNTISHQHETPRKSQK